MHYRHNFHLVSASSVKHGLSRLCIAIAASMVLLVAPFASAQTTATMVSPANGSTVSGTITISASISGPYGSVVFWVDNWQKIGQSSSPQLSYNTASLTPGSHQFFVSVLDSSGNTLCASNIVTVTVQSATTATMVSPANGSTVSGTITISASVSGSYGSVVFWRDNWVQIGQNSSPQLGYDTSSLSTGSHQFFVTVLDSSGHTLCASNIVTVTVSGGSPLPTPPQNAAAYKDLQLQANDPTSWGLCNGSCAGAGPNASGSSSLTFNNPSPSLSGNSMAMTSSGSNYWATMYYLDLGCPSFGCAAVQNMLEDMWFDPQSLTGMQQLEFDPDLFNAGWKYFGSVACRLQGQNPGYWYLWNAAANSWDQTPYPCTSSTIAAGTWHHLQLYVTFNTSTQQYAYQTFVFDGTTVFQNYGRTYTALNLNNSWTNVNIEQQIDNDQTTSTLTVYYDKYNLWVW